MSDVYINVFREESHTTEFQFKRNVSKQYSVCLCLYVQDVDYNQTCIIPQKCEKIAFMFVLVQDKMVKTTESEQTNNKQTKKEKTKHNQKPKPKTETNYKQTNKEANNKLMKKKAQTPTFSFSFCLSVCLLLFFVLG